MNDEVREIIYKILVLAILLFNSLSLYRISKNTTKGQFKMVNSIVYSNNQIDDIIYINSCSEKDLCSLPNIHCIKAKKIIKNRPIKDIFQLEKIKGIGHETINQIAKRVDFSDVDNTNANCSAS